MRIGIDYRLAAETQPRGIGRYVFNLVHKLVECGAQHEFYLYTHRFKNVDLLVGKPNVCVKVIKDFGYPFWDQWSIPRQARVDNLDLIHSTASTGPIVLNRRHKFILTVHDVSFLQPANIMPRPKRLYQKIGRLYRAFVVPRAARRADHIITVSHHTRCEVIELTGVSPIKTHVVYHGLNLCPTLLGLPKSDANSFEVSTGKYVLCVGGDAPHKNVERAIRVYAKIVATSRNCGFPITILGVKGEQFSTVLREVLSVEQQSLFTFIDFISDNEHLERIYRNAHFVILPSLNESFGMPALEAMACDAPVITSNVAAIPEIVGGAALLINSHLDSGLEEGILNMLHDSSLRKRLVELGRERIQNFSWERAAQQTLGVYESAFKI